MTRVATDRRLSPVGRPSRHPRVAVLVLPGGKPTSAEASRSWHLSNLRVREVARTVSRAAPRAAVYRLRYRSRGWNEPDRPALTDGREALATLTAAHPGVPIVLVGHSMGGRLAALLATQHPGVVGVVALAPWWPAGEADTIPRTVRLSVVHGSEDRWTDPRASARAVQRAVDRGLAADHHLVEDAGHFMLTHRPRWNTAIERALSEIVADAPAPG